MTEPRPVEDDLRAAALLTWRAAAAAVQVVQSGVVGAVRAQASQSSVVDAVRAQVAQSGVVDAVRAQVVRAGVVDAVRALAAAPPAGQVTRAPAVPVRPRQPRVQQVEVR